MIETSRQPVRSMTGCGAASAAWPGGRVEVSLSSVNRRTLEVVVSVPRSLPGGEARVSRAVGERLARGRVTGEVRVAADASRALAVDWTLAQGLADAGAALSERLGLSGPLSVSDVLLYPGVLGGPAPDAEEDAEALGRAADTALATALDALVAFREAEGARLADDLSRRVATLGELRDTIAALAPGLAVAYQKRLQKRIRDLLDEAGLPPSADTQERVLREVALFADRADVTEELVRLESHLAQFRAALSEGGAIGRRLDFLVQEIGREINTLGNKANDVTVSPVMLAFKNELERIREQIQNIE